MKKKLLAVFSAAAIAVSGLGSTVAYGSVYADINNVPWPEAATYIDEAYSLGLMMGYVENGQRYCKAKNNVTYCEAVQLMYAIMSTYSGTSVSSTVVSKWTNVMATKNIPSWAYNAVAYALENGILSQNDISIFMASSSKQNNARREDVAVIFGKALAKIYGLASNPTISYGDKSSVASTSVPYLELLNRLNIMVGDANNNFNPKTNINRAEMSVIVTKTYNKLKGNSSSSNTGNTNTNTNTGTVTQYSGKVTEKTSSGAGYTISLNSNGTTKTFTANATTSVIAVDGSSTTVAKINTGDTIVAVCKGTTASSIIIMAQGTAASSSSVKGNINSISTSSVAIKTSSKTTTYKIQDTGITVTIDGASSTLSSLVNKFKGGTNYTATVYLDSNNNVIKIEAKKGSSDGELDDDAIVSFTNSRITLNGGTKIDLPDEDDWDDITVKIDGSSDDFDELKKQYKNLDDDQQMIVTDYDLDRNDELDTIKVKIEDIKKSSSSSKTSEVTGIIERISDTYVKIDGEKYNFPEDDDDVKMKFDGDSYSKISKFVSDIDDERDKVYATIEMDDDEISSITAIICDDTLEGDIKSISSSEIKIGSKTKDLKSKSIPVNVKVGDGTITSVSKLQDAIDDDKMTVDATAIISDSEVVAITGNVTEIENIYAKKFYYSSTDTKCYLTIDAESVSTSVKFYFYKNPDIDGEGCSDLKDIKDYIDDNNKIEVSFKLDDDGKITDLTVED